MKVTVGGLIALILLGLYAYLVFLGCEVVSCSNNPSCSSYPKSLFNQTTAQTLSVIGGLVSALVIAELAITKPGEAPVARVLAPNPSSGAKMTLKAVTGIYLLVWIVTGLAAVITGMAHPDTLPPLTSVGQSWFGLSISAAYAYLGVRPS